MSSSYGSLQSPARPTSPSMALLMDPRAVKIASRAVRLTVAAPFSLFCEAAQSFAGDQISDVSHFPQVESLFQLGVPVDTFRDFSKEQATTVASEQSPRLVTAHGSFGTFCPSCGDHGGLAKLGEQMRVSFRQRDVPDGAVRKRAVVQRFSWKYWLRALRELLTGGRAAGRCILVPRTVLSWKVSPSRSSRRGVSVPPRVQRRHRRDLIGPQATQVARSRQRSCPTVSGSNTCPLCFCPTCCMRPPSADAM